MTQRFSTSQRKSRGWREQFRLLRQAGTYFQRELRETRPRKFYLAVAARWDASASDLETWIQFHRGIGVEHFFLVIPNGSAEAPEIFRIAAEAGCVTLLPCEPGDPTETIYSKALPVFRKMARWIALIAPDEALFSPEDQDLRRVLVPYETYAGVVVHPADFPPVQSAEAVDRPLMEIRVHRRPEFRPKPVYLVNPAAVRRFETDRAVSFTRGRMAVNEQHRIEKDITTELRTGEVFRLHRYVSGKPLAQPAKEQLPRAPDAPISASNGESLVEDRSIMRRIESPLTPVRNGSAGGWLSDHRLSAFQWRRAVSQAVREASIFAPHRYNLTACLIFKNSARYLAEWIEFHRLVGVEHFYLFNNASDDSPESVLEPYRSAGIVTLHEWPKGGQPEAYQHCFREHGKDSRWMIFMDDDEFIFPTREMSLAEVLRDYESYAGVSVPWLMFGSSGHVARPEGLVLDSYTRRAAPIHGLTKSIVQPRRLITVLDAHRFRFRNGYVCVNERKRILPHGQSARHTVGRLRINHYYTKSAEDVEAKINRRGFFFAEASKSHEKEKVRSYRAAARSEEYNQVEDVTIQRYLPALRKALSERPGG